MPMTGVDKMHQGHLWRGICYFVKPDLSKLLINPPNVAKFVFSIWVKKRKAFMQLIS